MEVLSCLNDERIHAKNHLVEMPLEQYLALAKVIIKNNDFQRRRVSSSATIYSLLKDDFQKGCVLPPIVLSLGTQVEQKKDLTLDLLHKHIDSLVILDGLQRTFTLIDLVEELASRGDNGLQKILARPLRVEIYAGLNRLGILYRMLTLNTGQTPMSLRQQIEMLYLDFSRNPIADVRLIREIDDEAPTTLGEYSFKAMVEGFNSYVERTELPIDRFDLLESIKTLESLSREDVSSNLFPDFVTTYHRLVARLQEATAGHEYSSDDLGIKGMPFGRDVRRIFTKSQAITGFGAAVGKLRDREEVKSFQEVLQSVNAIDLTQSVADIGMLLQRLEQIRLKSKKIGNSQRLYFHFLFRQLLAPGGDAYCRLSQAIETAYQRYETEML